MGEVEQPLNAAELAGGDQCFPADDQQPAVVPECVSRAIHSLAGQWVDAALQVIGFISLVFRERLFFFRSSHGLV